LLLFNFNNYRQSFYLSSANDLSSAVYSTRTDITSYVGLKQVNSELEQRNATLLTENLNLKMELQRLQELNNDSAAIPMNGARYDFVVASVLNNSISHARNYFTINKGSADGVEAGMGVINRCGPVGIVNVSGEHTSRVISLLNETQKFSVKIKGTSYVGSLAWSGLDSKHSYIEEIPRHAKYFKGDTIVTSGYSTTFPEGVPVGTVESRVIRRNDNFITLKIKLFPDFENLETVCVIKDIYKTELDSLQQYDIRQTKD
jgi:rod shape-determining protein MreC